MQELRAHLRKLMPAWIQNWLRDARLMVSSEVVVVLLSTALAILLARGLGPSDWGIFSAVLGLSLALSTFVTLGLGTSLLRDLSRLQEVEPAIDRRYRESSRRVVGGSLASIACGTLIVVSSVLVAVSIGTEVGTVATLSGLLAYGVLLGVTTCFESFLRAERKLSAVVAGTIVERCVMLVLAGFALLLTSETWAIAVAYVLAGLVRLLFLGFTIFVRTSVPVIVPQLHEIYRLVRTGIPFAFNTAAIVAIPKLDTLVVTSLSAAAAGYFALGDRIIGPVTFIPVVASMALYPYLAREARGSRAVWKISGGMILVGSAAAVIGALLAPRVVPTLFGSDYDNAVLVVQIMLVAVPFVYLRETLLVDLYTIRREHVVLVVSIVASLVGTLAIVVGLLTLGATGAAAGYVFRQLVLALALGGIARSSRRTHAPPSHQPS